jgi:transcriptional regulator with XRE-family HTH domain
MDTIGDRLKFALDAKSDRAGTRYTASDLARACGVTRQAVSQWILGQSTNIRPDNLICVADWLGVEVRWLATGDGAMLKRDVLSLESLTPAQRVTLEAVMGSFGKPPMKNDGTNNR